MRTAILIAVFAILLIAGCLQKIGAGSSQYLQDYRTGLQRVAVYSPNQTEECRQGSCVCMVCVNISRTFFTWWNSLAGGYCYFEKNCTPQKLTEIQGNNVSSSDTTRHFMFGQGPGFGSYASANTYCLNRLGMAVQWLIGSNFSAYMKPDPVRTMCFLQKDVIPVYILYSNGSDVNVTRARDIGHILGRERDKSLTFLAAGAGPVGPVVVVTEMNFDISKADLVAQQVRAIDDECNKDRSSNKINCFIAVAPKLNDFAALDAVMRSLGTDANKVDLVAFGVDQHYANTCSGPAIVQQALNFSQYSLYNLSKPTIIPYVLFDTVGTDAGRTCNWSESTMLSAYGSFDPIAINALQKSGVIGIAPYAFNATGGGGVTNPLNCTDCGVGKNAARLRYWYSSCQSFNNLSSRGAINPAAGLAILFGNESGTICNANADLSSVLLGTSYSGRDIMSPAQQDARAPLPLAFKCDACLLANASRPANTIFPSLGNIAPINNSFYCTAFPEIDEWASARNLDPMLVRAFVLTESGFNPCSAAKVCSKACLDSACTPGCFPADLSGNSECYSKAYDEMSDPRTGNESCNSNLSSGFPPIYINNQIAFRWCAVGLMQSLEPPYTFWPANYHPEGVNGDFFDVTERSGFWSAYFSGSSTNDTRIPAFDLARACDQYFNPFIPGDSICVGTAKMESMLRSAQAWIDAHRDQLGWQAADYDRDRLFAAYIAGNMYAGFWGSSSRAADHPRCSSSQSNGDCWAYGFSQSRLVNDTYCASSNGSSDSRCENGHPKVGPNQNRPVDCYGFTDFFAYVDKCEKPYLSRQVDPGLGKLKAFLGLSAGCANNACPDVRLTATATETAIPPGGTAEIPLGNSSNSSGIPPPSGH